MRNLFDFFAKYNNWLLFVLLEVVSFVMLFRFNSYQGSVWLTSANYVTGKIFEIDSAIEAFFSLTKVNQELTLKNFYLERQVNQLSRLYGRATGDTLVKEHLSRTNVEQYKLVPAKVVSNSVDMMNNLITIDKGRADGIVVDMGVTSGKGVVGVVLLVSDHYSIVMPLLNSKSRVSCSIRGRGYFGYTRWNGKMPNYINVEDIPRHAHFKRGDWVETSGYSSIFPPGIVVGKIIEVYNSPDGLSYRLKVHLSTDFANLRDVCVITDKTFAERQQLLQTARDSLNKK